MLKNACALIGISATVYSTLKNLNLHFRLNSAWNGLTIAGLFLPAPQCET